MLPTDIEEIILKETVDKGGDYQHMKTLLRRFSLWVGALRSKFEEQLIKSGNLWSNLVYDLRSYLENWLESV